MFMIKALPPLASAHCRGGNQVCEAAANIGNTGAWARPSKPCAASSAMNKVVPANTTGASGVAIVATMPISPITVYMSRAP